MRANSTKRQPLRPLLRRFHMFRMISPHLVSRTRQVSHTYARSTITSSLARVIHVTPAVLDSRPMGIEELNAEERVELLHDIAARTAKGKELAKQYGCTLAELQAFVSENADALAGIRDRMEREEEERADVVTPTQLDQLWISNKFARLQRYQNIAERLYDEAVVSNDPTVLRELRSYMLAAANELGQLLHRGSGDSGTGDSLNVEIVGVDMDRLI